MSTASLSGHLDKECGLFFNIELVSVLDCNSRSHPLRTSFILMVLAKLVQKRSQNGPLHLSGTRCSARDFDRVQHSSGFASDSEPV
jgi:hypothetical protein